MGRGWGPLPRKLFDFSENGDFWWILNSFLKLFIRGHTKKRRDDGPVYAGQWNGRSPIPSTGQTKAGSKCSLDGAATDSCGSLLLIYRSRKDERLNWPGWLTYSGRFTHISGQPSVFVAVRHPQANSSASFVTWVGIYKSSDIYYYCTKGDVACP